MYFRTVNHFLFIFLFFFFFKQKTAYEMRISDWSSDVCSSDLDCPSAFQWRGQAPRRRSCLSCPCLLPLINPRPPLRVPFSRPNPASSGDRRRGRRSRHRRSRGRARLPSARSEEHTSELQSLMRTSYAVFCLKKKST